MSYIKPALNVQVYTCPHCEHPALMNSVEVSKGEYSGQICSVCNELILWNISHETYAKSLTCVDSDRIIMLYPMRGLHHIPLSHDDMPEEVIKLYNEAKEIINRSPRSAAALLRLALEILLQELTGIKDKKLVELIEILLLKKISTETHDCLEIVRVIGNKAVHPGEIDLNEDPARAYSLFELLNFIVDDLIARPKKIKKIKEGLPKKDQKAIEKRAAKASTTE